MTDFIMPHLGPDDATGKTLEKHQAMRTLQRGFRRKGMFDNYAKFAVVRHPFDRIASLHQGYEPKCTLGSLIEQMAQGLIDINTYAFFWPQGRWLCDLEGNNLLDTVFRLEDSLEHVVDFLKDLGVPLKGELPHVNEGPLKSKAREKYEAAWNDLSYTHQAAFKHLYQWDYEAFGYE